MRPAAPAHKESGDVLSESNAINVRDGHWNESNQPELSSRPSDKQINHNVPKEPLMRILNTLSVAALAVAATALISQTASAERVCRQDCVGPVCQERCVQAEGRGDRREGRETEGRGDRREGREE